MTIADDLMVGDGPVTKEVLKEDTPANRRKIKYLRETGFPGIFMLSPRTVACVPSIVKAELARRAAAAEPKE
jgi:hypothetical protein